MKWGRAECKGMFWERDWICLVQGVGVGAGLHCTVQIRPQLWNPGSAGMKLPLTSIKPGFCYSSKTAIKSFWALGLFNPSMWWIGQHAEGASLLFHRKIIAGARKAFNDYLKICQERNEWAQNLLGRMQVQNLKCLLIFFACLCKSNCFSKATI